MSSIISLYSGIFTPVGGGGGGNWWQAGGATGIIAAWQPKSAADQTSSKINLANPETNNATDIVAPAWDSTNGWKFNGSSHAMDTMILPASAMTVIVQFTNCTNGGSIYGYYFGTVQRTEVGNDGGQYLFCGAGDNEYGTFSSSANMAMAMSTAGYVNGTSLGTITLPWVGTATQTMVIGARRREDISSIDNYAAVYIQAMAVYNNILNATKIAGVAAAMSAL